MSERLSQPVSPDQPEVDTPQNIQTPAELQLQPPQEQAIDTSNVMPFPNRREQLNEVLETTEQVEDKESDISDLVTVDAKGRGHVPSGKRRGQIISKHQMDSIASHQDQIRDGLEDRDASSIADLVTVDANGRGHIPSGKSGGQLLSKEKMAIIAEHQDQIRDGLADRNVELADQRPKPSGHKKSTAVPPLPELKHHTVDDDDTIRLIGLPPVPGVKPNTIDVTSADLDGDTVHAIGPKPQVPATKPKNGNALALPADYDPKSINDETDTPAATPNADKGFSFNMNGKEFAGWAKDRLHIAMIRGREWFRKEDGEVNKKKAVLAAVAGVALVGAAIYAAKNGFDHNTATPDVQAPTPREVPGVNPNGDPSLDMGNLGVVDPNAAAPAELAPVIPSGGEFTAGLTYWDAARDHLVALGMPEPSTLQIDAYKDAMLAYNNTTEAQAIALPVGTQFGFPPVDINSL